MKKLLIALLLLPLICSAQNRLKDKPTASSPAADDWLYLDGATNGVRKLSPDNLPVSTATQSSLDGKQDAGSYASAQSITDLSGGGPYALTLGPAPFPKYRVTISAATTFTVSGSPNAGDGAIIENIVTGAPRVVTYPTAYRNNAASTSTSVSVSSPRSDFTLVYTGTEYRWYDQEYGADDKSAIDYAADAGANDTYAITLSPAPTAYTTGTQYRFKANTANTGAATINVNGLGAKTIKKAAGGITTDLSDNDIRAGQHVLLVYDGTNMQMQSTSGNAASGGGGSVLFRSGSATPVIDNSAAWTTVFSVSVPANTLGTDKGIMVLLAGTVYNDSGAAQGLSYRIRYGSSTLYEDTDNTSMFGNDTDVRAWVATFNLLAMGATNAQIVHGTTPAFGPAVAATTGTGDSNATNAGGGKPFFGTSAEDSTTTLTFYVDMQFATAHANLELVVRNGVAVTLP